MAGSARGEHTGQQRRDAGKGHEAVDVGDRRDHHRREHRQRSDDLRYVVDQLQVEIVEGFFVSGLPVKSSRFAVVHAVHPGHDFGVVRELLVARTGRLCRLAGICPQIPLAVIGARLAEVLVCSVDAELFLTEAIYCTD